MPEVRSIELEDWDACLVMQIDGSTGIILPQMDSEEIVPVHIQLMMGIIIKMQEHSFCEQMVEIFRKNADNLDDILGSVH